MANIQVAAARSSYLTPGDERLTVEATRSKERLPGIAHDGRCVLRLFKGFLRA
jgi:hypothetical protein